MKLKTLFILSLVIFVIGFGIQASGQTAKATCSVDKTAGDWAFKGSGQLFGAPAMNAGTFHLNKDGTSNSHLFVNVSGTFMEFDATGKTTVAEDCTLGQTWDDGATPPAKCVVLDDSNEIWCVYTAPYFFDVTLKRIHRRE
jgi:hypothetical protein